MLEKLKILDVCAPWETQQYRIFILDIFHETGTLLNLDPGLIREASPSFVSYLLALLLFPYVPGILPPWNWRVRRDTVQSSSLYLPLIFTKVGKFNFIKCNSELLEVMWETSHLVVTEWVWMRCEFLFFYMVSLNLKITQISGSLTRHANLQESFHFAVPHITNDHIT